MNIVETLIVAAIVDFQDRAMQPNQSAFRAFLYSKGYSCNELVDMGDEVITDCGLGQEDWDD